LCALAAAEHQQPRSAFSTCKAQLRFRDGRNIGAHRIADASRLHSRAETVREAFQHLRTQAREHAVGQTGNRILLMNQQRNA
jgi:hypothetical protein